MHANRCAVNVYGIRDRGAPGGKRLLARGGAPRRHHPQSRQCPQKTLRA